MPVRSHDTLALVTNRPDYMPDGKEHALSYNINTLPAYIWSPYDIKRGSEVRRYDKPSRHPVVVTALLTLLSGVFWPATVIQARNDYRLNPSFETIDKYIVNDINEQLENIGYETFNNTIQGICQDALTYGFSISEVVYKKDKTKQNLNAIKIKPPFNFDIWTNATDEIEALYYNPGFTGGNSFWLDPRGYVVATWPILKWGNPYGQSEIMSIEQDILILQKLEEERVKAANLLAVKPFLHYYVTEGRSTTETNSARLAVQGLESGSVASFPCRINENGEVEKYDIIEVMEDRASKDAILDLGEMIKQHEKRITRRIGIGDDLGQTSVVVGSYAKAGIEFNMFLAKIQRVQEWITDIINKQVVWPYIKYNYDTFPKGYKLPTWKFAETEESFKKDEAEYYKLLLETGILDMTDNPHIREKLGEPARANMMNGGGNVQRTS